MKKKILQQLRKHGPQTSQEVAEKLKQPYNLIRTHCTQLKNQNKVKILPKYNKKTGKYITLYYLPSIPAQFHDAIEKADYCPCNEISKYKGTGLKKEVRTPQWLERQIISLNNEIIESEDREVFVYKIRDCIGNPNQSLETVERLNIFHQDFLRSLIKEPDMWDSTIRSKLLICLQDFVRVHLLVNQPNGHKFFHEVLDIQFSTAIMTIQAQTWYGAIRKFYTDEYQDPEVRQRMFKILTRAFHIASKDKLEESEELKDLIEKAFFSKTTGKDIFGYASETLMEGWREEEEKTEFWQKVNEQLRIEKDKTLKERFLNFIKK